MATAKMERKRACVTGATGYVGSMLVKSLLEKGYADNATGRDPANSKKVSHLLDLQVLGDLKLFKADLMEEGSFDDAINGCDFVFHVATPMILDSKDPENDMIKPAINGTLDVLKSCVKTKTVKRVVYTSSVAAVARKKLTRIGHVLTEESWSDVEYLTSKKQLSWESWFLFWKTTMAKGKKKALAAITAAIPALPESSVAVI
ncbi:anthocyanidin reductase-like [Magnolia sinica]|uniref:anthocyanidin reductase-like n=1 Tax=Magnolia sinica TaxID=86752 RepID=UPI002658F25C|nr:anthocyanidin reductase-like [Magnolia sinica]